MLLQRKLAQESTVRNKSELVDTVQVVKLFVQEPSHIYD